MIFEGICSDVQILGYFEEYNFHLFFNIPTHLFLLIKAVMAYHLLFLNFPIS